MPRMRARFRHEPVVRPEDGGTERPGHPGPPPRREPAHDLPVDALVRGHRGRRVHVDPVRRPVLGSLGEREDEDAAEPPCELCEDTRPPVTPQGLAHLVTEQLGPVRLVAAFGLGESQEDLLLLARPPSGELSVHARLGALVSQVATPALQGARGDGGRPAGLVPVGLWCGIHRRKSGKVVRRRCSGTRPSAQG